jgi:hypothetical protein
MTTLNNNSTGLRAFHFRMSNLRNSIDRSTLPKIQPRMQLNEDYDSTFVKKERKKIVNNSSLGIYPENENLKQFLKTSGFSNLH